MHPHFHFIDPHEVLFHETKPPHGNKIYFYCLKCEGTVMFNLDERKGWCFSCESTVKLHKMYQEMGDEELLDAFGTALPSSHDSSARKPDTVTRAPETIIPGPLSQPALTYIASRGISAQTLAVLPMLKETTCYGKQWLCWRNKAGSYELRGIGGQDKAMPPGSIKTYSQALIREEMKTLVICEGVFSILSYAQLFHYALDVYITLNSVSTVRKIMADLPTWIECGVEQIILALDFDPVGRRATRELYRAMQGKIAVRPEPMILPLCDWNDQLMEMMPR